MITMDQIAGASSRDLLAALFPEHDADNHTILCATKDNRARITISCQPCGVTLVITESVCKKANLTFEAVDKRLEKLGRYNIMHVSTKS